MKSSRIKTVLALAVVAMACFAMTTSANAGVITQTDSAGYPSEIGPYADDDLLQTNLASVTGLPDSWGGSIANLTDGTYEDINIPNPVGKFGWNGYNHNGDNTIVFELDASFDIGIIRVTVGEWEDGRSDQKWDVYTSENGGTTWDELRLANLIGHPGGYPTTAGTGSTITLTDSTGTLASNVNAIRFDTYKAFDEANHSGESDCYQEIDVFGAPPAPAVDAADYIALKTHMGQTTSAGATEGDYDDDNDVDWDDLQILQGRFREQNDTNANAIPEPASLLIMLAAGLPALLRRRRRS